MNFQCTHNRGGSAWDIYWPTSTALHNCYGDPFFLGGGVMGSFKVRSASKMLPVEQVCSRSSDGSFSAIVQVALYSLIDQFQGLNEVDGIYFN